MCTSRPRRLRITAVGCMTWDTFFILDRLIQTGNYAIAQKQAELPGGTTANVCVALHQLGCTVRLASVVGDDDAGIRLREDWRQRGLADDWISTRPSTPSDRCLVLITPGELGPERTIVWVPGARPRYGDPLPVTELFASDALIVDVDDERLRQFLVDLPQHIAPRSRLVGLVTSLLSCSSATALRLGLQHDVLIGNEHEFCQLTGTETVDQAIAGIQAQMSLWGMRIGAISQGSRGCTLFTAQQVVHVPGFTIEPVDVTGAGDAFAAGVIYGIVHHWELERIGQFANAVGALATRSVGAQTSLPTLQEVETFLQKHDIVQHSTAS
ncbi:carbohydrate kinase family protein [Thermorudis peleae]|uniref:carbohydrate kinase family protein n=1 Tax=Thermorudis peleae TaxID=1382356 RepID=UPI00056ECF38|nr:carbohydrate kinase family protein [Thermorudis peleae]